VKVGITCYPTYGGSGAVATELGIALAARGHEVHFITYEHPFRLPHFLPRVYFHEVNIGNYPLFEYPPYDLALAVRMHDVVQSQGLDLLHVHYAIPHATSAWIAKEMLREQGHEAPRGHHAARHRHHHRRAGPLVPGDHAFSIERPDRITSGLAVAQGRDHPRVRLRQLPSGCRPQLRGPDVFDRAKIRTRAPR
jgi:glycosyltransferase involved in cell wall biosynthesis